MRVDRATAIRFETTLPHGTPAERLAASCDMHDVAIAQRIARLRRERPDITEDEIETAVADWLASGDPGPGTPRAL